MIRTFILKLQKLKFYFITCLILSISFLITLMNSLETDINKAKLTDKCPFCFGLTACHLIDPEKLSFDNSDFSTFFSNYFGVKNVYYVKMNNKKMILKELATTLELKDFNDQSPSHQEETGLDFSKIEELVSTNFTDTAIKLRLCPTTKKLKFLLRKVKNQLSNENIWTLLKINPEPLVLQILPSRLDWPVPEYFGACGRLVLEEFAGPILSAFYDSDWFQRAEIASSLLNAAYVFTFQDETFAYYFTDVSFDNIAVDSKNTAKFIDLENVIIVDKQTLTEDQPKFWQEDHRSDSNFECKTCFIFSPADICEHRISDHNYYVICKHILASETTGNQVLTGFLHDIPIRILNQYPDLINLINQCSKSNLYNNKISIGLRLNELLKQIVKTSKS